MSQHSGSETLHARRTVGVFSWPSDGPARGRCSAGCAAILGAEVTDCAGFEALLDPGERARFRAAASAGDDFDVALTLRDGRLVGLAAARRDEEGTSWLDGSIEDLSSRRAEIAGLAAREELCRAVAENSPAMLWMGDQNGKCVFLNQAQRDFWGVDPEDLSTFDWTSTTHPDDVALLAAPFVEAMAKHEPFTVAARYRRADGAYRTLRTTARPRFDRFGTFLGMTGVNADVTDQLLAEERTRMLMGELNHRTKNILTVVQAVARQTARHVSPEEFNATFDRRLMGLAASNDLLLRSDWTGVEVAELVEAQLGHLGDLMGTRVIADGPRARIASTAAQTLGMALHELSTNSLKYGALGAAAGTVEIGWSACPRDGALEAIHWRERGLDGVTAPGRKGFGHAVMVDMVAAALGAEVDLCFEPDGLKWQARVCAGGAAG